MRKSYTILGNCQSISIAKYLNSSKTFASKYEQKYLPPVHTINKDTDKHLLEIFNDIDLLIYQPVIEEKRFGEFTSDKVINRMKKKSISICIPSTYYGGYFPTIESVEGVDGTLRGVHDFVILAAFLDGMTVNDTVKLLSQNFILEKDTILQFHKDAINSLRHREKKYNVDIEISSFIDENYKKIKLFHTFNHPTVELIKFICEKILNKLDIKYDCIETEDFLDFIQAPIYPEIYKTLGLEFKNSSMCRDNKEIGIEFLVKNDFEIYKVSNNLLLKNKLVTKKRFLLQYFKNIECKQTVVVPGLPEVIQKEGFDGIKAIGHRNYVGGLWDEMGLLQIEFLKSKGLKRDDVLLDIACGALRAGVHFIDYLMPKHYLGIDKESELIRLGLENELGVEKKKEKKPEFIISSNFEFQKFSKLPNYSIAQSLFTHLIEEDIKLCLFNLKAFIGSKKHKFFATFFEAEDLQNVPLNYSHSLVNFFYTKDQMISFGQEAGWKVKYIGDWNHPRNQKMIIYYLD